MHTRWNQDVVLKQYAYALKPGFGFKAVCIRAGTPASQKNKFRISCSGGRIRPEHDMILGCQQQHQALLAAALGLLTATLKAAASDLKASAIHPFEGAGVCPPPECRTEQT